MRVRARAGAVAAALTAAVAVAGCGAADSQTTSSSGTRPAAAATMPRAVSTIDDTSLRLPDGKPAAVFFFTVGCGSCQAGGAALAQVRAKAASKADFLLVDLDPTEPRQDIDAFRTSIGDPSLSTVATGALDLAQTFKVSALSTVVVLNPAGAVTWRATDPSTDQIIAALDKPATR